MKKAYSGMELRVVLFGDADVIATSGKKMSSSGTNSQSSDRMPSGVERLHALLD